MSQIKAKDIRNLSQGELDQKRNGLEKDLYDLRQKRVSGQLDKPHLFKAIKKQIAQINTVKRETKHAK